MDTILSRTFKNEHIEIDNRSFINCTLTGCTLEYQGEPVSFYATRLNQCKYIFLGPAKRTIMLLQETGLMPFDPGEWGEVDAGDRL